MGNFSIENLEIINISSSITSKSLGIIRKYDHFTLIFCQHSQILIETGDLNIELPADRLLVIKPDDQFRIKVLSGNEDAEYLVLRFRSADLQLFLPPGLYDVQGMPNIGLKLQSILIEHRFKDPLYIEKQKIALADLVISLYRSRNKDIQVSSSISSRVARAVTWVHTRLNKKISLHEIAEKSGYSRPYFYNVFKKETGFSPKQYVMHAKIRRATDLLVNSSRNMSEISAQCGFRDLLDFSRYFKKSMQMSPTEYRKVTRI